MKIDKKRLKDKMGRGLTQGLFLEFSYDGEMAVFTVEDEDKEYKGKVYPSLKKLFLASDDPVEYDFATTHLLGWSHWKKMCGNKWCLEHIAEWREELELKISSEGFRLILENSEDNYQAQKFLAEKGWKKKGVGRPVKDRQEIETEKQINEDYSADVVRMENYK